MEFLALEPVAAEPEVLQRFQEVPDIELEHQPDFGMLIEQRVEQRSAQTQLPAFDSLHSCYAAAMSCETEDAVG